MAKNSVDGSKSLEEIEETNGQMQARKKLAVAEIRELVATNDHKLRELEEIDTRNEEIDVSYFL
jgi:dephospho-CoA kinase